MNQSLRPEFLTKAQAELQVANDSVTTLFPGSLPARQPVHTVYGGAHLFKSDTIQKLGQGALSALSRYGTPADLFATAIGLTTNAETLHARVRQKLLGEPVEDFRIDFEDGYGNRADSEEDKDAVGRAEELATGARAGTLSPYVGIRIKPLTNELCGRSLRTLDLFVSTLLSEFSSAPANFVVTLPKITHVTQVRVLCAALSAIEQRFGVSVIPIELMVETTQSLVQPDGACALLSLVQAAGGRCRGAHFGTYDYTASHEITAAHQHMNHQACDLARQLMKVQLAGTSVWLSDGATNVMPIGPVREPRSAIDEARNQAVVHAAWRLHAAHIWHSLELGFYQGWDLHPAQLPTRYAAVFSFFLEGLAQATERLTNFMQKAAQATLVGDVFDDAATGQGLLNFFLRGLACGALTEAEAARTGLTREELSSRSFVKILAGRRSDVP